MFTITWKEIQKNLFVVIAFLVMTLLMSLMFNNYLPGLFEEEREMLATNYSMMLGLFVTMIIFSGLMTCEKEEDQSNGYHFLRTLPIEAWQIVGGKFLAAFVYAVAAVVSIILMTNIFGVKLESKLLPVAYSLFSAGVALILVGILYLFAFRIRYSRLMPAVLMTYVLALFLPQGGHLLMLIMDMEGTVEQLFSTLSLTTGAVVFGVTTILFGVIGYFAVTVKKNTQIPA